MAVSDQVMRHLHRAQAGEQGHGDHRTEATFLPDPEPRPRHYTIISVDDHLIEPADVFEGRVPAALPDRAPRVDHDSTTAARPGCTKTASTRRSGSTRSRAGRRPSGAWSPRASTRCGAAAGTSRRASPTWTSTASTRRCASRRSSPASRARSSPTATTSSSVSRACARGTTGTSRSGPGPHPDRIIPLQLAWLRDPEIAAADVRRNAERGFKAVSFPENPVDLEAAVDAHRPLGPVPRARARRRETVVCLHNGSSSWTAARSPGAPLELYTSLFPVNAIVTAADWLWARIPTRFPTITHRVLRGRDRLGADADRPHRLRARSLRGRVARLGRPERLARPTRCAATSGSARSTSRRPCALRDHIGIDHICLESDYPHADSTWPDTQLRAADGLRDFTPAEVRKVTWENASKLFRHPVPTELQRPEI